MVGEVVGEFTIGASAAAVDLANGTDGLGALKAATDALNDPTAAAIANAIADEPIEDHDTQGTMGWGWALNVYSGPDGPGIYIDSGASNTNTVVGTDGTAANPVSTFAAARTIADALGLKIYYLEGNSDITLAATHEDWEFIGIGAVSDNVLNLGSQDVDRSLFRNLTLEGTQGGTGRITARDCALRDPGAGTTTFHIFAERCGIVDDILVDTSADNVFDQCYSLAASGAAPIITATGASGSIVISHWGGKIELKSLSASHNIELDGNGHLTFNADCNVNATLDVHGIWDVTDNTAGMSSLTTMTGLVNMSKINTEADTALSDYDGPTKAEMDTAHALLATVADLLDKVGAVDEAAAVGDPSSTESLMQYLKQAINLLAGSTGIVTMPSSAAPANNINLFEMTRAIYDDTVVIGAAGAGLTDLGGMSTGMKGEVNTEVDSAFTTQMADSVPAIGTILTREQALYVAAMSQLNRNYTSTTMTIYKADGTTVLFTCTLDDASTPTQFIRAT